MRKATNLWEREVEGGDVPLGLALGSRGVVSEDGMDWIRGRNVDRDKAVFCVLLAFSV